MRVRPVQRRRTPANREALVLFEQALEISIIFRERDTLEQAIDIRFDIRNALQPLGDRPKILDYLREAARLAVQIDDQRRLGWVQSYLTDHFWITGRAADAAVAGERALAIARQLSDLPMQVVRICRSDFSITLAEIIDEQSNSSDGTSRLCMARC